MSALPDHLECAVCKGLYDNPISLPCHHVFCCPCIENWVKNKKKVSCPTCRNESDVPQGGVSSYPAMGLLAGLAEAHKMLSGKSDDHNCELCDDVVATYYCADCAQYMCQEDANRHLKSKMSKGHVLNSITEASQDAGKIATGLATQKMVCKEHEEPFYLYCESCKLLICPHCLCEPAHKEHTARISTIKAIAEKEREIVKGTLDDISTNLINYKKSLDEHNDLRREVQKNSEKAIVYINSEFDEIVKMVNGRREHLIEGVKEAARFKEKTLKLQAEQLEVKIESTERSLKVIKCALEYGANADVLKVASTASVRRKELIDNAKLIIPSENDVLFCEFQRESISDEIDQYGTIVSSSVDVGKCTVDDKGEGKLEIVLRNAVGKAIEGASARISIRAISQKTNDEIKYDIEEESDGKYIAALSFEKDDEECRVSVFFAKKVLKEDLSMSKKLCFAHVAGNGQLLNGDRTINQVNISWYEAMGSAKWKTGIHTWKVRIDRFQDQFIGVIQTTKWTNNTISNYNQSFSWYSYSGGSLWYPGSNRCKKVTGISFPQANDVIQVVLNCDANTLTITNLYTKESLTRPVPENEEFSPFCAVHCSQLSFV